MTTARRAERRSAHQPGAAVAALPDRSDAMREIAYLRAQVERLEQTVHQLCANACFDPASPTMSAAEWQTPKQAAFSAGVTLAAIYKWCRTDKIRSRKIGGKIFIEVSSLPSERKNV